MAFWFYESDVRDRAMIHSGDCALCNDGEGFHDAVDPERGAWHGPFSTLGEARHAAEATEKPVHEHRCVRLKDVVPESNN